MTLDETEKRADEKLRESAIALEKVPEQARAYLLEQKGELESLGFCFQVCLLRVFPSKAYQSTQWTIEMFDSKNEVLASALYLQREMSFFARILSPRKPIVKNRMFQSLFRNGCRLVSSDVEYRVGEQDTWKPPVYWLRFETGERSSSVLERHRSHVERLKKENGIEVLVLRNFEDYRSFPQAYPYRKP